MPLTFSVTLPPRVSVPVPVVTRAPELEPLSSVSDETVWLKPFRSIAPAARAVNACDANAPLIPCRKVPEFTTTPPVRATLRLASSTPDPDLPRIPVPVTAAFEPSVRSLSVNSLASVPPNATVPVARVGWIVFAPPTDSRLPLVIVTVLAAPVASWSYRTPPDSSSELIVTVSSATRSVVSLRFTFAAGVAAYSLASSGRKPFTDPVGGL